MSDERMSARDLAKFLDSFATKECSDNAEHAYRMRSAACALREQADTIEKPTPMRLHCPECGEMHIDVGEFATRPHHTHACQECGHVWRPAIVNTVGVRFLPGFRPFSRTTVRPERQGARPMAEVAREPVFIVPPEPTIVVPFHPNATSYRVTVKRRGEWVVLASCTSWEAAHAAKTLLTGPNR